MSDYNLLGFGLSSSPFVSFKDNCPQAKPASNPQSKSPSKSSPKSPEPAKKVSSPEPKKKRGDDNLLETEYYETPEEAANASQKQTDEPAISPATTKKLWLEWTLKPGKRSWKHDDPFSIQELKDKIKEAKRDDISREVVDLLKDKSKWSYYPLVAIVCFFSTCQPT